MQGLVFDQGFLRGWIMKLGLTCKTAVGFVSHSRGVSAMNNRLQIMSVILFSLSFGA